MRLHDADSEEEEIRRALMNGTPLDDVVPDPGEEDDFEAFFASLGEDVAPPPPINDGKGMFDREVDFLREALREAFPDPSAPVSRGGVGWAEHPDEHLVELVPPRDLQKRLEVLPQGYLQQRKVREKLLLAVTPEAGTESLRRATQGTAPGDQSTQWPQAHYLSPLHPVLDWAVDRALTRLGRNQVPVATAAVDAPTVIALGTLANQRGQIVLSSTVAMTFFAPPAAPFMEQDVPELLERVGFRSGAVNTGAVLDLDAHAALVPAAVAEMQAYMNMQKRTRADLLSAPLSAAARRVDTWRRASEALADRLAPGQAARCAAASPSTPTRPTNWSARSPPAPIRWCGCCSCCCRRNSVPEDQRAQYGKEVDGLANLQLLAGTANVEKTNKWPWEWLAGPYFVSDAARDHYRAQNDLDLLPESFEGFLAFSSARRERIEARLRDLLGVEAASLLEAEG